MESTIDLFELIKSLTKAEKRRFNLSIKLDKRKKIGARLFDVIVKMKKYDLEIIKKEFQEKISTERLNLVAISVREEILHILQKMENNIESKIQAEIQNIKILFNKCLYKSAIYNLEIVKRRAIEYEMLTYVYEIIQLEIKIVLKLKLKSKKTKRAIAPLHKEAKQISENILAELKYSELAHKLFIGYDIEKYGTFDNKKIYNEILIKNGLPNYPFTTSFYINFLCVNVRIFHSQLNGDLVSADKAFNQAVKLWQNYERMSRNCVIFIAAKKNKYYQIKKNSLSIEILEQGLDSVLAWFNAQKQQLSEIKILLLGQPKAGKTSLLRRLKNNSFDENEAQTDGINIESLKFGECETFAQQKSLHQLTGHFWDFGGQEIMNATHQFFLTRRSVYILVLDARKDADVAAQVKQWLNQIKATGGNSPVIVVANQIDINTAFDFVNRYELQKEFPQIKHFIKLSCQSGENIDELKSKLAVLIPMAELFHTEIDERWISVKELLQTETKTAHFLSETRFKEICAAHELTNKNEQQYAIRFLNDLGLVLHFPHIHLSEYYVLDPYWITYGVYQIVTSGYAGKQKGIIKIEELDYIVNEEEEKANAYQPTNYKRITYSSNQRRFLVDILHEFKLCFYRAGRSEFILPELLEANEPRRHTLPILEADDSIQFVYKYRYLPKSTLSRIMVEKHKMLYKMWRTGCILQYNGSQALVAHYQNRITITVIGDHKRKREFMAVIRHLVDSINEGLTDQPKMLIPLPESSVFENYNDLLIREKGGLKKITKVIDDKLREFNISELLEGIPSPDEVKKQGEKAHKETKTKILFLGANPKGTSRIRIDEENRKIEESLGDQFVFSSRWAVTPSSLQKAILKEQPDIVHFSGHGTTKGIQIEDSNGYSHLISEKALKNLFAIFSDSIKCVLINACHSENLALAIATKIPYTIGMDDAMSDNAAITFAVGFYQALGEGKSIKDSFDMGVNLIELEGISGDKIPKLFIK